MGTVDGVPWRKTELELQASWASKEFNSAFKYNNFDNNRQTTIDLDDPGTQELKPSFAVSFTTYFIAFLSYFFFIITLPITYWLFVKKLGEFDRLVVYRLGRMIGVKGPGRVLVFLWMDRTKRVDVRASAFSVPPQQFVTSDGGIAEMGGDIQYGIVDVVTMVSEVFNHQEILRSLSKTLLVKTLVRKSVRQIQKERLSIACEIQDEINLQVRKWGIHIQRVDLSEPYIVEQPENLHNDTMVGGILRGLGLQKSSTKEPEVQIQMQNFDWGQCLEVVLQNVLNGPLNEETFGLYKLEIMDTMKGKEIYFLQLDQEHRKILSGAATGGIHPEGLQPDVTLNITSADLAAIFEGSLAPLQGYLTGRISASGNVRKLMLFDKFSKSSSSMFNNNK